MPRAFSRFVKLSSNFLPLLASLLFIFLCIIACPAVADSNFNTVCSSTQATGSPQCISLANEICENTQEQADSHSPIQQPIYYNPASFQYNHENGYIECADQICTWDAKTDGSNSMSDVICESSL